MTAEVLLDAGVVTRCRRRVHLEHDPTMLDAPQGQPDPAAQQRIQDARLHRRSVADRLMALLGPEWTEVPHEASSADRERITAELLAAGARYIWGGQLPADFVGGRRGRIDLLVRASDGGYFPVLVVRHKITDPGNGARTTPFGQLSPVTASSDAKRKTRPQPRDQLRLAHAYRMLQAAGFAPRDSAMGAVIGLAADVVLWHDLAAATWPNNRTALTEYDARFADRLAIASAAIHSREPLAQPSRILDCRGCPWWSICEPELIARRDVSLVVRGEDAVTLRSHGLSTVDQLAVSDPAQESDILLAGMPFSDAVLLAKAWSGNISLIRRHKVVRVPRADVEVDIDMESFGDSGAYLWGCYLSGADIGELPGYRAFVTWEPLPTQDEARSFAEFWSWFTVIRLRARARGFSFRAYCYNELAENRWLLASAERFAGKPGIPTVQAVREFISSEQWVDLFAVVQEQFLCAQGKGLKKVAPVAGFSWRDPEASGENSMRWYRDAVGADGAPARLDQRTRLLEYNEDDVCATATLRNWMDSPQVYSVPFFAEL